MLILSKVSRPIPMLSAGVIIVERFEKMGAKKSRAVERRQWPLGGVDPQPVRQ